MDKKFYVTPEMEKIDLEIKSVLIGVSTDSEEDIIIEEGDAPGF